MIAIRLIQVAVVALFAVSSGLPEPALAQTQPAKRKPVRPPTKKLTAAPALPAATPEQIEAATLVFYGPYDCELNQSIEVAPSAKSAGYIDVKHGKSTWLMKPVLSSTGAVRLEDVKGQTLVVQIANKSMLMDVKAGRRLVDECVSARQRELIEAAANLKAQEAVAAAAAQAASAAAVAASSAAVSASAAAEAASAVGAVAPAPK